MQDHTLFFGASLEQSSLLKRLFEQFIEASREFHSDPRQFIGSLIKGDGIGSRRRKKFLQYGLAISLLIYSTFFLATLVFWTIAHRGSPADKDKSAGFVHIFLPSLPYKQEVELRKGDKEVENHGGGGGGDHALTPESQGERPDFAHDPPPLAPTTRPTTNPPSLQMLEQLLGDPTQNLKRDELAATGSPNGVVGPPSDGPGTGKGIGTGKDGGVGSGEKRGIGPGNGGGQGNKDFIIGQQPRSNPDANEAVDIKPIALNKPRPTYTEEARKNKVQGLVRARVLVGADGIVKQVKISGAGLPNGLSEEAIQAAKQMRFQPAMKNGEKVAYWVTVDIEFNLR